MHGMYAGTLTIRPVCLIANTNAEAPMSESRAADEMSSLDTACLDKATETVACFPMSSQPHSQKSHGSTCEDSVLTRRLPDKEPEAAFALALLFALLCALQVRASVRADSYLHPQPPPQPCSQSHPISHGQGQDPGWCYYCTALFCPVLHPWPVYFQTD